MAPPDSNFNPPDRPYDAEGLPPFLSFILKI